MPSMGTASCARSTSALAKAFVTCMPLLPNIVGLMLARTGIIISTYGSYSSTDNGIYTDGGSLISLAILALAIPYLAMRADRLPKRIVRPIASAGVIFQAITLAVTGTLNALQDPAYTGLLLATSVLATLAGWSAIFFWLRRARGASAPVAVLIPFGALVLSEPAIYITSLLPVPIAHFLGVILVLLQYVCARYARRAPLPADIRVGDALPGYFSFADRMVDSVRFLAITAIGMFITAIAIGLLRGHPNGEPIAFYPATRIGYMAIEMVLFSALICRSLLGIRRTMTVAVWVSMQITAALALLAYTALPNHLDVGAMFATVTNATMTGFMWYLVIVFSSYGERDPYYYAIGGWTAFILPRSIARVCTLEVGNIESAFVTVAVIGVLLLVSAQFVYIQFIWLSSHDEQPSSAKTSGSNATRKILGVERVSDPAAMRKALMRRNAEEIQRQFMLSDRETEVLTLYALGLTQNKIAEELCISPGTAHTHIKRIYAKTDFHSRQDVLDYIEEYTERR